MTSSTPANCINLLTTGEATIPLPLGAGINLTATEPHLPVTLHGKECG